MLNHGCSKNWWWCITCIVSQYYLLLVQNMEDISTDWFESFRWFFCSFWLSVDQFAPKPGKYKAKPTYFNHSSAIDTKYRRQAEGNSVQTDLLSSLRRQTFITEKLAAASKRENFFVVTPIFKPLKNVFLVIPFLFETISMAPVLASKEGSLWIFRLHKSDLCSNFS